MRYHILATDYDGTIAAGGKVDEHTLAALRSLLATGRRLVLVTGRELPDLMSVFPELDIFELIVAENGALLYSPAKKESRRLADPPPEEFAAALRMRGVGPMSVGEVIVATWEPHSQTVLDVIREQGLELQVIFNKGAVMVLPAGVNKATGLTEALRELLISPHNVVGVGDAENDHSFLRLCEQSVAVANALPAVKGAVDRVTPSDHGAGVAELARAMVENDLADAPSPARTRLTFGEDESGEAVTLDPHGTCVLICGASASGKSTVARRVVESLQERSYQFCLVDPEGDYEEMPGAVVIGTPESEPSLEETLQLLEDFLVNGVVCMTGVPISDRPRYFVELFSELLQMRVRYGRPHWLVFDEAHHLMPAEWQVPNGLLPETLTNVVLITVHPELLSPELLRRVTHVIAVGATAPDILATFAERRGCEAPPARAPEEVGQVLLWSHAERSCRRVAVTPPSAEHRRHIRKYAEGRLAPDRSFYFRGPLGKLNLRAQNLLQFLDLAEGVDEETWRYHFERGDYSQWFRNGIKDDDLAAEAAELERAAASDKAHGLALLRAAIERRYTLPADSPVPVRGAQ
jgi:hydroxymethylpyrimidine pyrophosphatase-like HAD family hydrolase